MANVLTSVTTPSSLMAANRPQQKAVPSVSQGKTGKADFRDLFTAKVLPAASHAEPKVAVKPSPTAESVFGPNPWIANPTGIAPDGQVYSYNPQYFATAQTAAKVAQMAGGKVVANNQFTAAGGPFLQQQPNYMVQLPNGHLLNAGLVASLYTHGYSQSYVDQMVAAEIRNA